MPKELYDYLQDCQDDIAESIVDYLDGNPNAIEDMIKVLCDSHAISD